MDASQDTMPFVRNDVVLVCVYNDAESLMILLLAKALGMAVVRSAQQHGARLENESDLYKRIGVTGKNVIWTVEIPGPSIEYWLRCGGRKVVIIDHRQENDLDRTRDAEGNRLPSSLEQFLALAQVSDKEIWKTGFDPRMVRGIGIFDDRFARGLRDDGYTHEEIIKVIDLRNTLLAEILPDFADRRAAAEVAWNARQTIKDAILVESTSPLAVRVEVAMLSIRFGVDTKPLVISDRDGKSLYAQNVPPEAAEILQKCIGPDRHSVIFGAGCCIGIHNEKSRTCMTLDELLRLLSLI